MNIQIYAVKKNFDQQRAGAVFQGAPHSRTR